MQSLLQTLHSMMAIADRPLLVLALVTLVGWTAVGVWLALGIRSIDFLREEPPAEEDGLADLSVVIPARNEARKIGPALRSVLSQDYGPMEVVVVDDRSTDSTGEILDRMAEEHDRLRVLHLESLPEGWLGKNHALQRGAEEARGELLLFADADVVMRPDVVRRAVGYLERRGLDHVTAVPELEMPGRFLEAMTGTFKMLFGIYFRPWKASDPESRCYVGTGAFNLVRARAYRAVGGHDPIALRPADDLKLGRLLKRNGYRQAPVYGTGLLSVEWYSSLGEMVRGLDKNSFAVAGYRLSRVVVATAGLLLFLAWPGVAVLVTEGPVRWLNAGVLAVLAGLYADNARFYGHSPWHGVLVPLTAAVMVFIGWRSALRALITRQITWRETSYPLEELREAD